MSDPKRHHYLAQFYQAGFTADGRNLWLYDRKLNKIRSARPNNTALIGHYYSFTDADGTKHADLEKYLSVIEGRAASAIKAALNKERLTDQQRSGLAEFIAFQFYRTPRFDSEFRNMMEVIFNHGLPPELVGQVECSRNLTLKTMWDIVPKIKRIILLQDWFFLRCPPGPSFATNDCPFTIIPPKRSEDHPFATNGICMPGVQKWFPLNSRLGLMMGDRGDRVFHSTLLEHETEALNGFIALGSFQYLLARDEQTLKKLIALTELDTHPPMPLMTLG